MGATSDGPGLAWGFLVGGGSLSAALIAVALAQALSMQFASEHGRFDYRLQRLSNPRGGDGPAGHKGDCRLLGSLLSPELGDQPPDDDEQQRAEKGRNQVLKGDFEVAQPQVDVEDSEDQAANQGPHHADAEVGPPTQPFLLERHQSPGQITGQSTDDQPHDELPECQVHDWLLGVVDSGIILGLGRLQ